MEWTLFWQIVILAFIGAFLLSIVIGYLITSVYEKTPIIKTASRNYENIDELYDKK